MTNPTEPFRYCLNTSTIRKQSLPLTYLVEIAAEAGYDAIEPWIDEIDKYVADGGSLSDLKKRIEDHGMTVEAAIGFFNWVTEDEAERAKGFDEARRNMELLAAIGGKRLAAPAFGATDRTDVNLLQAAERYRELLVMGEEYNVIPQVEVWGFSKTLRRLGEAALVAIESGHPQACILADSYHLYKGGSDPAGLRLLNANALRLFHINDYPDIPPATIQDSDRVYPGDGIAPLGEILRALRDIGFSGALSLELFNDTYYRQDPKEVAKTGLEKTRAVVQSALA